MTLIYHISSDSHHSRASKSHGRCLSPNFGWYFFEGKKERRDKIKVLFLRMLDYEWDYESKSLIPYVWYQSAPRIALVGVEGCVRYQWDPNDHADEIYASYGLWNQLVVELWAAVGGGFWPWSAWFSLGLVAVSHQLGIEYRLVSHLGTCII